MLVERSTTWLFVRISPFEVRISPVPAAWPDPTTVLMSTRAGSTLAAMAAALLLPFEPGLAGWIGEPGCGGCWTAGWLLFCATLLLIVRARLQPMPAPAAAATTAATTTAAAMRCQMVLVMG